MSEFNSCASLINSTALTEAEQLYNKLLAEGKNPMQTILDMQKTLQNDLSDRQPQVPRIDSINTKGELYNWCLFQKLAIDDEFKELVEAIGGMSKPVQDRSAIWKKWKSKYNAIRAEELSEMPEDDKIELAFELTDILHFISNLYLALGISAKEMFMLYYIKNAENLRRYEGNY